MKGTKGTIIERNGSYRIRISLGKNEKTGKYENYFETVKGNKADAQKRLRELLNQQDKKMLTKPEKLTIKDFLAQWLKNDVFIHERTRTYQLYKYIVDLHIVPEIGNIKLTSLTRQRLQTLYADKLDHGRIDGKGGLSKRTVQLIHVVLHKAFEYAISPGIGLLSWNPAFSEDAPTPTRREMKILSEEGYHSFLESVKDSEYYCLWFTYLHTGMRRSELLAVQWSDVDLLNCTMSITRELMYNPDKNLPPEKRITFEPPKTDKSRRLIDLTPSNAVILRKHLENRLQFLKSINPEFNPDKDFDQNELVFCHPNGSPLLPQSITHAWIKAIRKAGFTGVRLHDSRHTHASLMLKQGIHVKIVSERLGHAGTAITNDLYTHVLPGLQKSAAAKFDEIESRRQSKLEKELQEIFQN